MQMDLMWFGTCMLYGNHVLSTSICPLGPILFINELMKSMPKRVNKKNENKPHEISNPFDLTLFKLTDMYKCHWLAGKSIVQIWIKWLWVL